MLLQSIPTAEKVELLIAFAAYLFSDCRMKKENVGNYFSGNDFNNLAVKKILAGMHLLDAVAGKQPDQKKPFPLDTVWNKMMRVAALMAYFLLLRQSEYIWQDSQSDHALRVK